jgi:methanol metabolism-related c-type cytochrome
MKRLLLFVSLTLTCGVAFAEPPGDPKAVTNEDGKYFDANGDPTFNVTEDGTVDWYTFSGYRRYHSDCHVCHGPAGQGSTYAPPLIESLKNLNYTEYLEVVTNGRQKVGATGNSVMPAFGTNKNVMCYADDIYVYLRARSAGAGGTGRPPKKEEKPKSFTEAETACMGG